MYKPISTKPHPVFSSGTQKIYRFPNNYGASVVTGSHSYGGEKGLWELAVIKFSGPENGKWSITYNTEITEDVMGWLTNEDVEDLLTKIESLENNND